MPIPSRYIVFFCLILFSCSDTPEPQVTTSVTQADEIMSYPIPSCPGQFFCILSHQFASVRYTPANSFPAAFGASASWGDRVYFAGGHEEGSIGFAMADVNVFVISQEKWYHTLLSVPRSHLAGASAGDKVLFAGGTNISSMNPVYGHAPLEYYDVVEIFDAKYHIKSATDHLSEKRAYLATVSTTTKAYFIGGKTLEGFSSKMDVYDAEQNTWTVVEMPRARGHAAAVSVSEKIYVFGGQGDSEKNLTVTDIYDIQAGEWSSIETPHEHPIAAGIALDDRIFMAGGDGKSNTAVDIYNTVDGTWRVANLSDSRYDIAVAAAGNKIIFFGGAFSHDVDVYDQTRDSWSVATLSDGVTGVAAATANNQCFFMAFLYNSGNSLTNSMISILP